MIFNENGPGCIGIAIAGPIDGSYVSTQNSTFAAYSFQETVE
jgi:hypothetical protein